MLGGLVRFLLATALGFYFRRIELLAPERVPAGPLLVVANHPNSLADAAVLAAALGGRSGGGRVPPGPPGRSL